MKKQLLSLVLFLISIATYGQIDQLSPEKKAALYPSKAVVSRYHNDWTQRHYSDRIKVFKKEPLNQGEIIFIGNSITEQGRDWSVRFGIDHIRNRGIAGDLTDGALKRLDEITYSKPNAVFILLGVNDLFNRHHAEGGNDRFKYDKIVPSPQYVGKNILKIAKAIRQKSPATKIYIRTVLPTRRDYLKEDIVALNWIIKKNQRKGKYTVIDLYEEFVDEDGAMKKELTKDGVHLNDKGYECWVAKEKSIIESLE